jgi:hypothetical protein
MEKIGAAVWATGHAGRVIVEAGLTRPWLAFRAGIVYSAAKEGLDLGEACGLDVRPGAPAPPTDAVLARPDIDVVFYTGVGTPRGRRRACVRTARARTRSRSPARAIRGRSSGPPRPRLDAGARAAGAADPRDRVLGLPDDHPAAGLHVER